MACGPEQDQGRKAVVADGSVIAIGIAIGVAVGAGMHQLGVGIAMGFGIAGVLIAARRIRPRR